MRWKARCQTIPKQVLLLASTRLNRCWSFAWEPSWTPYASVHKLGPCYWQRARSHQIATNETPDRWHQAAEAQRTGDDRSVSRKEEECPRASPTWPWPSFRQLSCSKAKQQPYQAGKCQALTISKAS